MDKSPFTKEECEFYRERTGYEKLSSKLKNALDESFVQSIPSATLRQLPPRYLYPMGVVLFSALIAVFVAVFVNGYKVGIRQTYLSPLSGYTADKYCETIPIANSGDYLTTQSGIWEGQEGFDYSLAAYWTSLTSFTISYDEYKALFALLYDVLSYTGNQMYNNDLGANLLIWMTTKVIPPGQNYATSFGFTGTPLTVFNRQKTTGTLSNVFADCDATSRTTFDSATGMFTMIFVYREYINNPKCNSIFDLELFDYISDVDGGQYLTLSFDSRTSLTGLGMGAFTSTTRFIEVADYRYEMTYEGYNYTVSEYLDPKYSGMKPLICAIRSDDVNGWYPICAMRVSSTVYGFPLFNHIGNDLTNPTPCDCSTLTDEYLNDPQSLCNRFVFLNGFLFFNSSGIEPILSLANELGDTFSINADAFNAQFVASYYGRRSENRTSFETMSYRQSIYDFCKTDKFGTCSLVTFTSFDVVQNDWAINSYYYQVKNGACRNTITEDDEGWQRIIEVPFGQLNEKYQQCKNSPSAVFLSQTGVSMGNVSLITPAFVLALMILLTCYQKCFKVTIQRSYNKDLRDRAINTLAISLLLARDSKLRKKSEEGDPESMLLVKIVEELAVNSDLADVYTTHAKEEGGFNWRYIVGMTSKKARAPLVSKKERVEKRVNTVSKSIARSASNKNSRDSVGASPVLTASLSSRSSRKLSIGLSGRMSSQSGYYSVCEDALSDDPDLIILNKPTPSLEVHHHPNKHRTPLIVATEIVEEFITKFDILVECRLAHGNGPEFWLVSSKASQLGRLRLLVDPTLEKNNEEQREFYLKLKVLVILHGSLLLNCDVEDVYREYADKVAYFIHGEVLQLREINRRAGGDEKEGFDYEEGSGGGGDDGFGVDADGGDIEMNMLPRVGNGDRDSDDDTDCLIEEAEEAKEIDGNRFQHGEEPDDDSGYELPAKLLDFCRVNWDIASLDPELEN